MTVSPNPLQSWSSGGDHLARGNVSSLFSFDAYEYGRGRLRNADGRVAGASRAAARGRMEASDSGDLFELRELGSDSGDTTPSDSWDGSESSPPPPWLEDDEDEDDAAMPWHDAAAALPPPLVMEADGSGGGGGGGGSGPESNSAAVASAQQPQQPQPQQPQQRATKRPKHRHALVVDVPPAIRAQAAAAAVTARADVPAVEGVTADVRTCSGTLSLAAAERLLRDNSLRGAGPRPALLSAIGAASLGYVFKDDVRRRKSGSDEWLCKGGKKGSYSQPTIDGQWAVRRSYGTVKLSQADRRQEGGGATLSETLRYHQYTLEKIDGVKQPAAESDAAAAAASRRVRTSTKLFHVLKDQDKPAAPSTDDAHSARRGPRATVAPIPPPLSIAAASARFKQAEGNANVSSLDGLLEMRQPQQTPGGRSTWISFRSGSGEAERERGAVVDSARGAKLTSGSGDFAEWHARREDERPFQEGDVVGFDRNGTLTRQTSSSGTTVTGQQAAAGVWQLGIITRRAVVEGNLPSDESKRSNFDTVAYSGRVVVRLLGSCSAGDYIVPSGREDGTACALSAASARPSQAVGRALLSHTSVEGRAAAETAADSDEEALVEVTVIAPPDTVQRPISAGMKVGLIVLLVLLLASIVLFGVLYSSGDLSSGDGPAAAPIQTGCPPATVSTLANGLCENCAGADAVLQFGPLGSDRAGDAGTGSSAVMEKKCPATHHGSIRRVCPLRDGTASSARRLVGNVQGNATAPLVWLDDGSAVSGSCKRKYCPELELALEGYSSWQDSGWSPHHVVVTPVPEGSGMIIVPCPSGDEGPYRGNVTLFCESGSEHWSQRQRPPQSRGESTQKGGDEINTSSCVWLTCPQACLSFNSSDPDQAMVDVAGPRLSRLAGSDEAASSSSCKGTEQVALPRWSVGDTHRVLCCRELAAQGGCASPTDGLGSVTVRCDDAGEGGNDQQQWSRVKGRCAPPSALQLGLGVSRPISKRMAAAAVAASEIATQQRLFEALRAGMAAAASNSTAGRWAMPSTGRLARLHASWNGGTWTSVVSEGSQQFKNSRTAPTILSGLHDGGGGRVLVQGRAVVALANVSCRQLGLGSAHFVSNCRGLRRLTEGTANASALGWTADMMEMLCPAATTSGTQMCNRLLEVSIRDEVRNREADYAMHDEDPTSMCMGNESHVGQCFRYQLAQSSFPPKPGLATSKRYCDQALVVACSAAEQPAGTTHGVWVVGDDSKHPDGVAAPAVVADTGFREGCWSAGDPACWASALPSARGSYDPQ